MKKVIIAFIIAFATIAVGLICLLTYSINHGTIGYTYKSSSMKLVNTQNISLDSIDEIDISYRSDDVTLHIGDSEDLILKEYMNYTPEDDELSRIDQSGSVLTIKNGKQVQRFISFDFLSNGSRIEIYLPSNYSDKLSVETSSGNIDSSFPLKLSDFTATSTSGNIEIDEVYSDRISAAASSGNIRFQVAEGNRQFSVTSGNIKVLGGVGDSSFASSSGNITIENASGNIEAEASSGNIDIIDSLGGGEIATTSGNIKVDLTSLTEDLEIHASSGDVRVMLPDSDSFNFTSQTSSGDIRTFFDDVLNYSKKGDEASGTVGANPEFDVTIETSSGNIRVED
jgi:hypothetical protein